MGKPAIRYIYYWYSYIHILLKEKFKNLYFTYTVHVYTVYVDSEINIPKKGLLLIQVNSKSTE